MSCIVVYPTLFVTFKPLINEKLQANSYSPT